MNERLKELNERMELAHVEYMNILEKMLKAETKYNKVMVKLVFTDTIRELPNQAQRDAQIQEYLLNHDEYKDIYREHLEAQNEYKKIISYKMLLQEQSRNLRAMTNYAD